MTHILLIVLTVFSSDKEPKEIELRLPYSSKEECLNAEKKIDFSFSSIISLHTPLDSETNSLINKNNIIKFNKGTILINTARGRIVDSLDTLLFGLEQHYLSFIGLDVLPEEPPNTKEKLIKLWKNPSVFSDRIIINPHSAYYSKTSWIEMRQKASLNIKDFLIDSKIKNRIN